MPTTTPEELDAAARLAQVAADRLSQTEDRTRARYLTSLAVALETHQQELIEIAQEETSLPVGRLTGEVARTAYQLRLFATAIEEGSYLEASIDHPNPNVATPVPDLRRILVPIGPVAVFAASNFPFAFSVLGGDTASALAVGNPVVVKAHEGHPRLSERVAEVAITALADAGAPAGTLQTVTGREAGTALVQHPSIRAVGFTGSTNGGRALFNLAVGRPDPIPFYGELGSVNPVVITQGAVAARVDQLAEGLAGSFTLGVGQFCTKPGVVFAPAGSGFASAVSQSLDGPVGTMLNPRIRSGFASTLATLAAHDDVRVAAGSAQQDVTDDPTPTVLVTTAAAIAADPAALFEEVFGPAVLIVEYETAADLDAALAHMPGSLTSTVHAEPDEQIGALVKHLAKRSGRVLNGGWPTGVAVAWAQHHGGPYPSTTSVHTSVGVSAMRRFQRPVAYQDMSEAVLPPALRDGNPLGIPQRVDGRLILP